MGILRNKLFILLILLAVAVIAVVWIRNARPQATQQKVIDWIVTGYSEQFCNVIFPRIGSCVTIPREQCSTVAKQQVNHCLQSNNTIIPAVVNQTEIKKIYNSISACFQERMHRTMLENMVVSAECKKMLS